MAKYGMQTYLEPEENIKFESDNKYLRDVPSERTIYDFQKEIDFLFNKGQVIDSKVHMMSDIICSMTDLKGTINIPYKTESDFQASNLVIDSKLKDITSKVSECLKGTGLEVGPNPQSFKSNFVDVKLESFDGMNFEQKVTYRNEGIGSVFSKIWEYIKKFFSWVWESIKKLFNSVFNLFRSNKKLLQNLKLELEKMNLEKGERNEYSASAKLVFFTQVLDGKSKNDFVSNVIDSFQQVRMAQSSPYLSDIERRVELCSEALNNNISPQTLISDLKSIYQMADKAEFVKKLMPEASPNTRQFKNGNFDVINVGKFKDPGYYYLIGMDNDEAVYLYSKNGVTSDLVRASIMSGKDTMFKRMTPENAKQELIDMCELGISICEDFDKKGASNIETDIKGQETDMTSTIEVIGGMLDGINGFDDQAYTDKVKGDIAKEMTSITNVLTKNINKSTTSIIGAISVVAKQPTFIIQAVKEGMDTIE